MNAAGNHPASSIRGVSPPGESVDILGVRIHRISYAQTVELVQRMVGSGKSHHVVTVNPEIVMAAHRNAGYRDVLNGATLSIPDGVGILYASSILGSPLRERIAGSDLTESICALSPQHHFSVFLLGAADGVAERTAEILADKYPGIRIRGTFAGSPSPDDEEDIRERINAVNPDFLFVAFGSPAQEFWIARNLAALDVSVAIGIGGTFDFISGRTVRAPQWVRSMGMEWLHRLLREPKRWRRMLVLPRFALKCVSQRVMSGKIG